MRGGQGKPCQDFACPLYLPAAPPQSEPLDLYDCRTSFSQPLSFLSTVMERHSTQSNPQQIQYLSVPNFSRIKTCSASWWLREKQNFEQNSELFPTLFSAANNCLKEDPVKILENKELDLHHVTRTNSQGDIKVGMEFNRLERAILERNGNSKVFYLFSAQSLYRVIK